MSHRLIEIGKFCGMGMVVRFHPFTGHVGP